MTQTHLRWIRMALPVDANWKKLLVQEVHPLLQSADQTGAINQWFFNWVYRRGPQLELYLEADSTAVHTILRPMLQERFGDTVTIRHPNKILDSIGPRFSIMPADLEEDNLIDLHVISSQLVASHEPSAGPGVISCFTEVNAALHGVKRGSDWVSAFAKTQLGDWLDQYFKFRFTAEQFVDRQQQEAELLTFLGQQPPIAHAALLHPLKTAWIEGFQELSSLFDGELHIKNALDAHIQRYGLSPFQVGQMWLENVGVEAAAPKNVSALG